MSPVTIQVVLLIICILFSAFFSSSETAFTSLEQYRVENMLENKVKGAKRVAKIKEKPERFLSTILLGNNLVNTAAAALATSLATYWFGNSGVAIATGVMTFLLLVFAETAPKTIATTYKEKVSVAFAPLVSFFTVILSPVVFVIRWIVKGICKLFGADTEAQNLVQPEDIQGLISVGSRDGTVEEDEAEILNNVFEFSERPVTDVLVPRLDVIGIPYEYTIKEFLAVYAKYPLSRFPVYQDTLDDIKGMISIKDVLMAIAKGKVTKESPITAVIKPATFVPENKNIGDLFNEIRSGKAARMVIVVDEYGAMAGIATINDLVEEILGPLGEELITVEKDVEQLNNNTFLCDAGMRIDEINEELDLDLPEGDYDTLAGFILDQLGHFPKQGQMIRYENIKMVISVMKGLKIEEVRIIKDQEKTDEQDQDKVQP